jgi:hypothetical protein
VCEAANDSGCPSKRIQKYRFQTALTSDRLCLKTNIDHRRSKRYFTGYYREKKRDKVHLHIQFARNSLPRQLVSAKLAKAKTEA